MPLETQIVVAAVIMVFAFFMVLVAWAERRAGGSFDVAPRATPKLRDEQSEEAPKRLRAA